MLPVFLTQMAAVHIDGAPPLFDLLKGTPDHIIPWCQIGHGVVALHETLSQGIDQVRAHAKKGVEPRGAEPFGYNCQTDILHVRQLDPRIEGCPVQISSAGRAIP